MASQFEVLRIKSQAKLQAVRDNAKEAFLAIVDGARQVIASQEDVRRAFAAYAQAAREAAQDSNDATKDQTENQLEFSAQVAAVADAFVPAGKPERRRAATHRRDSTQRKKASAKPLTS